MITTDFFVNENKVEECKRFIKSLPTAKFNYNPLKMGDRYNFNITLNDEDGNKISQFISKLHKENLKKRKKTFFNFLKNIFH